jgi:hypothetical protein
MPAKTVRETEVQAFMLDVGAGLCRYLGWKRRGFADGGVPDQVDQWNLY